MFFFTRFFTQCFAITCTLSVGLLAGLAFTPYRLFARKQPNSYHFVFGNQAAGKGAIRVQPGEAYTTAKGYGFDKGTTAEPTPTGVTGSTPFYFSVRVPEGNYQVTLTLGDAGTSSCTTVKAESRRLMLEHLATRPGQYLTRRFTLNVRTPRINDQARVQLKPKEQYKLDWDDKLTLEFNDTHPAVRSIRIEPLKKVPMLFLAGNSTVVDQDDEPWASWGQMITGFLQPGIAVANYAESGLSLGSFLHGKRLDKVLSTMQRGDYLLIEFGHNDQKEKGPDDGAYSSYTNRLRLFVQETKKKGGIPVIVTPVSRRFFDSAGRVINTLGDYPEAARRVAAAEQVTLIDLNALTQVLYEAWGPETSKKAFVHYPANSFPGQDKPLADNTHFNSYGAYEIARCIAQAWRNQALPLARYLLKTLPPFNAAQPDDLSQFNLPRSPHSTLVKPDGN